MFLLRRSMRSFLTDPIKRLSSGKVEDLEKKLYDK
jgi:superfamily II RNA helicase